MARKQQTKRREHFGQIDKQRSGRYRARYLEPTDKTRFISAPATFATIGEARDWLVTQQGQIAQGNWRHPAQVAAERKRRDITLAAYGGRWVAERTNAQGDLLKPRTRGEYERLLRAPGEKHTQTKKGLKVTKVPGGPLAPLLERRLEDITEADVRSWRADLIARSKKTTASRAYGLLHSIMATAVEDKLIDANPCTVKGGSKTSTGIAVLPPTDAELDRIIDQILPKYRALVVVAAVGGLRYGEAVALRASDVTVERDTDGNVVAARIRVERAVSWVKETDKSPQVAVLGEPKSVAGVRSVAIFGDDAALLAQHSRDRIGEALLWPNATGGYLHPTTFHRHWRKAREEVGRPDLKFHSLRHYAGTRYSQAGATVKETMARLGHSSTQAAMRYQHAGDRDDELAARLARRKTAN